jgi:Arc/MetJ-type ribon-helix-helix transcriptional regulator
MRLPTSTLKEMEVRLTADQEAFIRQAIETGRLHHEEDAVEEAMLLLGRARAAATGDTGERR